MNINMFDRRIQYFHTLFMPLKTSAQYHTMAAIFRKITVLVDMQPKEVVTYPKLFMLGSVMQTHKFVGMIDKPKVPFDIDSESTGAAMNKEDLEKFLKYFAIVQSNYGATETTRTFQNRYTNLDEFVGDIGNPLLDDIIAEVVDDTDTVVADTVVGSIRLKTTPRHVSGYYNDPEETNNKFRNGYFYPGDLAYKDGNKIFVSGRKNSTMINIGGIKIDPVTTEDLIRTVSNIIDCLVFKNTELDYENQLSIFVSTNSKDYDSIMLGIKKLISEKISTSNVPRSYYFVKSIPLNDNGKPWRSAAEKIAKNLKPIGLVLDSTP